MPKRVKDKWLGARADDVLFQQVNDYIEQSDNLTMGELVRTAVREYMWAHPREQRQELQPVNKTIKPTEE